MNSLHSWLTWLLFQEEENRHPFQPNFEAHQPCIPLSPYQGQGTFIIQTTQQPYTNSPYIIPNLTTKALTTCTPSQPTSFTEQNSSQIHLPTQTLQRRPTDDISSQNKSPKAPTGLMKCPPCTPSSIVSYTRQKQHLHATPTFS